MYDAVFAMTAVGYYGIIDLVGKGGVILQHEKSTRCQERSKDGRSCSYPKESVTISHDARS
jgi:hypothetical protein